MTADAWRGLRDLPDSEVASPAPRTGEQGGGKAESTPFRTIGGISGLRVRVVRRARNITPILRHRLPGARRQRGESTSAPTGRVPPRPAQGAAPRTRSAWERTSTSRSRGTGPNRLTPGWTPSWTSQGRRRSGARSIAAPGSRHDEHAHERAVFHGRLVCWDRHDELLSPSWYGIFVTWRTRSFARSFALTSRHTRSSIGAQPTGSGSAASYPHTAPRLEGWILRSPLRCAVSFTRVSACGETVNSTVEQDGASCS